MASSVRVASVMLQDVVVRVAQMLALLHGGALNSLNGSSF